MTSWFAFQASTQILTRKHVGPFYLPSLGPGSLWDLVPEKCFWAPKTPDPSGWSAQTQDSCVFTKRSARVDGASGYLTAITVVILIPCPAFPIQLPSFLTVEIQSSRESTICSASHSGNGQYNPSPLPLSQHINQSHQCI